MISRSSSCFQNNQQELQICQWMEDDMLFLPTGSGSGSGATGSSAAAPEFSPSQNILVHNFSILKEKVQQLESFVISVVQQQDPSAMAAISSAGNIVQEIIAGASSVMCSLQQLSPNAEAQSNDLPSAMRRISFEGTTSEVMDRSKKTTHLQHGSSEHVTIISVDYGDSLCTNKDQRSKTNFSHNIVGDRLGKRRRSDNQDVSSNDLSYDVLEPSASDLLAKYTHYCQICSKGFRRDANLRMHMRAHGDEYKTAAALSNPAKNGIGGGGGGGRLEDQLEGGIVVGRKYSCPHGGCRWNKSHAQFQPLKSMVCLKNHYKRSHCPKMYVCKRCSAKQFSVLSDLRTHEKHCGDLRWRCSCGTNFSRKDKLMGHVALFVGHTPLLNG